MSGRARAAIAALLVIAAVVMAVVAVGSNESRATSAARPALATPLWSVRRVPEAVFEAVGAQHLQRALDGAVSGPGACFVVESGNHTIASHEADTPLIGASTQKLLVAAAALAIMGPNFTYHTRVLAPAPPANGTVDRLWLVGSGDPTISTGDYNAFLQSVGKTKGAVTTSMESLADAIVAKGIRSIPGGIVADDSRYDGQRYNPAWKDSYRTDGEVGPIGALTVNDGFGSWSRSYKAVVDDPAIHAASVLASLLRARGVDVGGASRGTPAPGSVDIASLTSPKLSSIIGSMLAVSDNTAAEMLTKELGVQVSHAGTTAAGVSAITNKVQQLGVNISAVHLDDGSGLARSDRVTCNVLASTLGLATNGANPQLAALVLSLPVAAQTGTLFDEFVGSPVAGRLRAKTGSLDGVSALAGIIDAGEGLRFAFIENGNFSDPQAISVRAPLGTIFGKYPDAPPVDALVPAPK